jgi:AraC family transcriptional regulator, regulatory protein of adaptative response / methylated-DNA-[protein]-cysteine methyltransferase
MEVFVVTYTLVDSPIGEFIAGTTHNGICLFEFADRGGVDRVKERIFKRYRVALEKGRNDLLNEVERQAREYFNGSRQEFSLPLDQEGTPFELSVWNELRKIPYGETRSYGEIATRLGKSGAARAVGRANGANYIAIIVPCHRVIEENGQLRGYGGGLWRKQYLLDLERRGLPTIRLNAQKESLLKPETPNVLHQPELF